MSVPQSLWDDARAFLRREGHHFAKMYRIEVTWNEIVVWHDEYKNGEPVIDKDRGIPVVTRTRIL